MILRVFALRKMYLSWNYSSKMKIITLKCPEKLYVLKLRQTQVDFERVCRVHFFETDFWTLVMPNWHNGQGAKELQA